MSPAEGLGKDRIYFVWTQSMLSIPPSSVSTRTLELITNRRQTILSKYETYLILLLDVEADWYCLTKRPLLEKYQQAGKISIYRKRDRRRCNFQYGWARPREEQAILYKRAELTITPTKTLANGCIFSSVQMSQLKFWLFVTVTKKKQTLKH